MDVLSMDWVGFKISLHAKKENKMCHLWLVAHNDSQVG